MTTEHWGLVRARKPTIAMSVGDCHDVSLHNEAGNQEVSTVRTYSNKVLY